MEVDPILLCSSDDETEVEEVYPNNEAPGSANNPIDLTSDTEEEEEVEDDDDEREWPYCFICCETRFLCPLLFCENDRCRKTICLNCYYRAGAAQHCHYLSDFVCAFCRTPFHQGLEQDDHFIFN